MVTSTHPVHFAAHWSSTYNLKKRHYGTTRYPRGTDNAKASWGDVPEARDLNVMFLPKSKVKRQYERHARPDELTHQKVSLDASRQYLEELVDRDELLAGTVA